MTFLEPDIIRKEVLGNETVTIKVRISRDNVAVAKRCKPLCGTGKAVGVTVHRAEDIVISGGGTPIERYMRAVERGSAAKGKDAHFIVWRTEIWQILKETCKKKYSGTFASHRKSKSGRGAAGGVLETIIILCFGSDAESEESTAKLAAMLLKKHGLSPAGDLYVHPYFRVAKKSYPASLIARFGAFARCVRRYYDAACADHGGSDCRNSG